MHLYLIRHGQSHVNLETWTGGNADEGLTNLGQRQAEALAAWLPRAVPSIDALYCSTMRRARETVEPLAVAYNHDVRFDDRLREVGNNRLDHTPWPGDALPNEFADYWASERPFAPLVLVEGGESWMHFRTRVGAFIEELVDRHYGETVVVVCHGGVVEAAFDHIFNVGPWRRCEIWDHNTAITHFEYVNQQNWVAWRLHYHNRVDHLREIEGITIR
jgi:probable phosphoglycerate mutase